MENEELTREDIENIEKFKAIKCSRLFYSTIDQLLEKYELEALKTNCHGKYKNEIKNALNDLRETCRCQTEGTIQLDKLLEQYEASSNFYKQHIQYRKCLSVKQNRWRFLDLLLVENAEPSSDDKKVLSLYNEYKERIDNGAPLNPGIILLLTLRLIPTYKYNKSKDIISVKDDYNRLKAEVIEYIKDKKSEYLSDINVEIDIKIECLLRYQNQVLFDNDDITNRLDLISKTNNILDIIKVVLSPFSFLDITRNLQQINESFCCGFWKLEKENKEYIWYKRFGPAIYKIHYLYANQQMHKINEEFIFIIKANQQGCYIYGGISLKTVFELINYIHKDNTSTLNKVIDICLSGFNINIINKKELENADAVYNLHKNELEEYFAKMLSELKKAVQIDNFQEIDPLISRKEIILNTQEEHYQLSISEESSNDIPDISKLHPTDYFYSFTQKDNGELKKFIVLLSVGIVLNIRELLGKNYFKND